MRVVRASALVAFLTVLSSFSALAQSPPATGAVPTFSPTGFDAEFYGEALGYPVAKPIDQQQNMVGGYSHFDSLYPTRPVAAPAEASVLKRAPQELSASYTYWGVTYSIEGYLKRNPTTGLLIARGDTILFEHYQYGRTDEDRLASQSLVKTMLAMLVGIAIGEGAIKSIDDPAQAYVPEMANTELGLTPIRALLHMASGVAFTGEGGPGSDLDKFNRIRFSKDKPDLLAALSRFDSRIAAPGTLWRFDNVNAEMLGVVLARATHMSLSQYLQSRIWQPMGAEASASWAIDPQGQELAACCFNAVLRDYARFALVLAHEGAWNGRQIIPRQWLLDATEPVKPGSALALDKSEHPRGYGYLVWLQPGPRRTFMLEGIHGQIIFVDPLSRLVLVHMAVRRPPVGDPREDTLLALWQSVLATAGTP